MVFNNDDWILFKIGDLGKIVTGKTPKTKDKDNFEGNTPFLTPSDDMEKRYIKSTSRTLSNKGLEAVGNKIIPKNSICVSCIGSQLGKVVLTSDDTVTNQQINSIIPSDNFNFMYVYYAMKLVGDKLNYLSKTSTAVPIVNKREFSNQEIYIPPFKIQNKIANILSAFDDKIETNNKIINNLEEQAQAIFKSWFVDFEPFQDEEFVESELGRIPRNWRIATLKEFFPVVTGKKNANIATENGKYPFFTCAQDISYTDDFSFDDHAILVAGNGDFNVKRFKGKFEAYQRTYVLIPSDENLTGLLYHLINHYLKNIVLGYKGSVINYITKGMIEDFKFPFPNKIEEVGIVDVFNTIEKKIAYTKRENIKLEEIRDTLLPKLMSGELRVEEAIEVE